MIWILSGTKDGAELIRFLKKEGFQVFASAVTEYGAALSKKAGADYVSAKALNYKGMGEVIKKKKIDAVVDATHPFAAEASKNAMKACKSAKVKYLRYGRKAAEIPNSTLIHYARDFKEAGKKARQLGDVIFFAAGSRNLEVFLENAKEKKVIARILPDVSSVQRCFKLGLKPENVVAVKAPFSEAFNKAMLREYGAEVLVTKESGTVGGVEAKVNAALALDIPVVIIERPKIEYRAVAGDYSEVLDWLRRMGVKK